MFSQACVKISVHGGWWWGMNIVEGHAWQGGIHGRGVCVAVGHAWQGGVRG